MISRFFTRWQLKKHTTSNVIVKRASKAQSVVDLFSEGLERAAVRGRPYYAIARHRMLIFKPNISA
ncbi:14260_t:CDS:2 [Rhizophagus irregularis]|nr:14260_t:CDS:2 [Rhizophagus irregularis]